MYEAVASLLSFNASIYFATGESPKRRGNAHATIVPYETFEASDGWISLGVANDELWKRFCKLVERPELTDDPRFAKAADRVRNRDILVPIVKDIIKQRKRDEWLPLMDAAGIPSGGDPDRRRSLRERAVEVARHDRRDAACRQRRRRRQEHQEPDASQRYAARYATRRRPGSANIRARF